MDKSIFTPQDFAGGDFGGFPVGRPDSKGHYAAGNQHRDNTFPIDTTWSTSPFNTHFGPLDQNLPFTEASYPSLLPASAMLVGPNMSGYVQDPMAWAHSQQPMISGTTLSTIPIAPEVQSGIHGDFSRSGLDISLSESQPSSFDTNLLYPSSNSGWNASLTSHYSPALDSPTIDGHEQRMEPREPALSTVPYVSTRTFMGTSVWATTSNRSPKRQAEMNSSEISYKVKKEGVLSPTTNYCRSGISKSYQRPRHSTFPADSISNDGPTSPPPAKRSKKSASPISTDGSLNMSPYSSHIPDTRPQKQAVKGCPAISMERTSKFIVFNAHQDRSSKPTRAAFDPERRQEVAKVRALGACFKCKMWRKKCNLETPCQNCKEDEQQKEAGMLFSQPCFRLNLDGCHFFRYKSALWTKPLRDVMIWISTSPVPLSVKFSALNENGPQMEIQCCHFRPEPTDVTQRKWGTEVSQVVAIPTYCAYDRQDVRKQLPSIIDAYSRNLFLKLEQSLTSESLEPAMLQTLRVARKRAERGGRTQENQILEGALNIWYGVHFMAQPRTLNGDKTLGLEVINDPKAHDNGYIPIPPMLDYQLDTSAMEWMESLMKPMLKSLWKILLARSKKEWFNVFLAFFILLDSLEIVYGAQTKYIKEHGSTDLSYFGRHIKDFSEPMLERWSWSAQHLIFVFRYYIKRRAFGSAHLFSHTIFKDAADAADLDPEAREYYALMIDRLRGSNYPWSRWKNELLIDKV